jgi:hypothetical protein
MSGRLAWGLATGPFLLLWYNVAMTKLHHCTICDPRGKGWTKFSFSLPEEDYARYKKLAAEKNMSLAALIRHALHSAVYNDY